MMNYKKCYLCVAVVVWLAQVFASVSYSQIDRRALVCRHNPVVTNFNVESPLSVGNGNFAFTVDFTGLQTFPELYIKTIPLGTMSQWGWHSFPNPQRWCLDKYHFREFNYHGRKVLYADVPSNKMTPEAEYLRNNPHRFHLGRIGFFYSDKDGTPKAEDVSDINQILNLWEGVILSRYKVKSTGVEVETFCHPKRDIVCCRVKSSLVEQKKLGIVFAFPYGASGFETADWSKPQMHQTEFKRIGNNMVEFKRRVDDVFYMARVVVSVDFEVVKLSEHHFVIVPSGRTNTFEFLCEFGEKLVRQLGVDYETAKLETSSYWSNFWMGGGAVDLSESQDARWKELERRIVLSQYLTAIQCAGIYPPAESGLTFNSWAGKFHLEMHWWHAAHFALWNRTELLERSLWWYESILPQARKTARLQGFEGARFPKMTSPSGIESPSSVGPFLIWQQPHPIYLAELIYRANPKKEVLKRYCKLVEETADFMASFAWWDVLQKRYVLGPPLQCAQERYPKESTFNPVFELTYWRWGLETAQKWRERLGLKPKEKWERVLKYLSLPVVTTNGMYLFCESAIDSYTNQRYRTDHPSVLAAFGFLPGGGIDVEIMENTFNWIWDNWNWKETWGWDYPLVAMSAARLGKSEKAIDALLMDTPKNRFGLNGHNYQRPNLSIYLPANGGLLSAIAMMCAGWDGAANQCAPGFPTNGLWKVKWENLLPMP
ncbi:MAG: hypothetical protein N2487_01495 [Verrucomicrobiae bacterium]|nr:hypothetical protein [Verrucomicrobiae bacterium]